MEVITDMDMDMDSMRINNILTSRGWLFKMFHKIPSQEFMALELDL